MAEISLPNESGEYRQARAALLEAELELRAKVEEVAALRRQLPPGGALKEDYVFREQSGAGVIETPFSDLFKGDDDTLFLYNYMYAPPAEAPCFMCTVFLDGLDDQIPHIEQRISTAVVAKHEPAVLEEFAKGRGWKNFRMLSSGGTTFNEDYLGEIDGVQNPIAHIFTRKDGVIRHAWSSEMEFAEPVVGGNGRHLDMMWPLWNVLDLTPMGRENWYPSLNYSKGSSD